MAFERIGLGAVLTFDGKQAVTAIGSVQQRFTRLLATMGSIPAALRAVARGMRRVAQTFQRGGAAIAAGARKVSAGVRSMAFGMAPLTLAVTAGAKKFADFEQQMSVVKSITGSTGAEFDALSSRAKQLGASTQFTATEAAQGMEFLSRAGFSAKETIDAVGGALNLAAADSIDLATAADITAQTVRAMGMEASQANMVADMLAQTSRRSNTNVIALGESMKFAASTAKQMNIPLDETLAIVGKISDAGLRGTIAGTSFTNMMVKLSKPSSKAKKLMEDLNIEMKTFRDEQTGAVRIDFPASIESMSKALLAIEDPMERAAASAELFGIRGQKAANAFLVAGAEGLTELNKQIKESAGVAEQMAKTRLDNFTGQITLLTSALEGFAIEIFGPILGPLTNILRDEIIPGIQGVVAVMQKLKTAVTTEDVEALRKEYGNTIVDIALGIADAIRTLREGFTWIVNKVKELGEKLGATMGEDGARRIAKIATMVVMIGAALTPVILALLTVGLVIGGIISVVSGVATALSGAFVPILIAVAVIGAGFSLIREEGETVGQTLVRVWGQVKTLLTQVWENALRPLFEGMREAATVIWPELREVLLTSFGIIKEAFIDLLATLGITFNSTKSDWREWGRIAVSVVAALIEAFARTLAIIVTVISAAVKLIKGLALVVIDLLIQPFITLWNLLSSIFDAFMMIFSGDIIGGLKKLGQSIINFLLAPIRSLIRNIVRLADAVHLGDQISQGLRDFANQGTISLTSVGTQREAQGGRGKRGAPEFLKPGQRPEDLRGAITDSKATEVSITNAFGQELGKSMDAMGAKLGGKMDKMTEAAGKSPCIDNNVRVNLDGSEVARSQSRHQQELKDRAGFKATPWQRRLALEHGGAPKRS